jgi:hypothetical protein
MIRGVAEVGDWVVGTGSAKHGLVGRLVFAMEVSEALTFDEYWADERFRLKQPTMQGSKKQAFGDNIYYRSAPGRAWRQLPSHHSLPNGRNNPANIANDTGTNRVLVAERFAYFGGEGPVIPRPLRNFQGADICAIRGFKSKFDPALVVAFVAWFDGLDQQGYIGAPQEWILDRARGRA